MSSTPIIENSLVVSASFRSTHWSVVLASQHDDAGAQKALATLCRTYWYPLYAFVRRRGYASHDAQDLTQEFFTQLLERESLRSVSPEKGTFRSFLLASLKNFLVNEWTRSQRQKRGGGLKLVSLDEEKAEDRYRVEPAETVTPDLIYDRTWTETLLNRVLVLLESEHLENEKADLFQELKPLLCGEKGPGTYAEIAARHGISEGAVKMTVVRLRQRYAALLRSEIAQTVSSPEQVEQEIRHLLAITTQR
jgi:RNA polymerase sigma factor (sigma-70 family)